MARDARGALYVEHAFGRHPLPRVEGLVSDAQMLGERAQSANLGGCDSDDFDHGMMVGITYLLCQLAIACKKVSNNYYAAA